MRCQRIHHHLDGLTERKVLLIPAPAYVDKVEPVRGDGEIVYEREVSEGEYVINHLTAIRKTTPGPDQTKYLLFCAASPAKTVRKITLRYPLSILKKRWIIYTKRK